MSRTREARRAVRVTVMAAEPWEVGVELTEPGHVLVTWGGRESGGQASATWRLVLCWVFTPRALWGAGAWGTGGASSDPISKCRQSHAKIEKQKLNSFENPVIFKNSYLID